MNIIQVLTKYYSNAKWVFDGDSYEGLIWKDKKTPKPTQEEIDAYIQAIVIEEKNNEYAIARKLAYPTIEQQLDDFYHLGYDGWKSKIDAIKNTFPKPKD